MSDVLVITLCFSRDYIMAPRCYGWGSPQQVIRYDMT